MQKDSKISVTTQTYFGDYFYNIGWAILILSIPILVIKWYVGIIAAIVGAIVISSVYKLVIDVSLKQIDDYLFFMGMKNDRTTKQYNSLRHIKLKSGRYSQQLNYKSLSTVVEGTMYSAYLVSDIENFYLGESKSKKRIAKKAKKIADQLKLKLVDAIE